MLVQATEVPIDRLGLPEQTFLNKHGETVKYGTAPDAITPTGSLTSNSS